MARPKKEGLDYFPLDVDIFEDEKIEAISGEFGIKGELIVIKLLCAVYKNGYFVVWNDLTKMKLLKRVPGSSKEMLDQVVNRLVKWGFFHEDLFNSVEVLTSKNIQETFFEATKRRKSPKPTKYIIGEDGNEVNVNNNSQGNEVNDDINTQSKVKESKVNKSNNHSSGNASASDVAFGEISKLWQEHFPKFMNEFQKQDLSDYVDKKPELTVAAFKLGLRDEVTSGRMINWIESVLSEWEQNNITTTEEARKYTKQRAKKQKPKQSKKGSLDDFLDGIT